MGLYDALQNPGSSAPANMNSRPGFGGQPPRSALAAFAVVPPSAPTPSAAPANQEDSHFAVTGAAIDSMGEVLGGIFGKKPQQQQVAKAGPKSIGPSAPTMLA